MTIPNVVSITGDAGEPTENVEKREKMLGKAQQQKIVANLNRIEGQLRGIRRMIEEPRLCIEILQQLAAAQAALGRVSSSVLKYHVDTCVPAGMASGDTDQLQSLAELVDIVDRFSR